jgi:hypothetical protein
MIAGLASVAWAQTVTVDVTNGAPNNTTTFNSLMMAIHSFQVSGKVTASTDGAGVGVNNANVAPNVINVLATGAVNEIVRIDERASSAEQCVLNQPITIQGPGAGAVAPSAAANAIVSPQDDGANDDDGFEIRSDVDVTVNNITFIPSPTVPPGDDLVTVDKLTAGSTTSTVTFKSCVFTTYMAGNVPTVQSKSEALVDNRALITTPGPGAVDDLFDPFPDPGEAMIVNLIDCVLSHSTQDAGNHDGIVEVGGLRNSEDGFIFNIQSSVISFCQRYGIQYAGGGGGDATRQRNKLTVTGSNAAGGPVAGLGGPTVIHFNQRGIQAFTSNQAEVTLSNVLVTSNTLRGLSMNSNTPMNMTDVIVSGPTPVVITNEATSPNTAITRCTFHDGSGLYGDNVASGAVLTIRDSIFSGAGSTAVSVFSIGDMIVDVDNSATVLVGDHALAAQGGTTATTFGAGVITAAPLYASLDPLNASFLDVANCAYFTAATGGTPLRGGANFVGSCSSVSDWTLY